MPRDYGNRLSAEQTDMLVDYLLEQKAGSAQVTESGAVQVSTPWMSPAVIALTITLVIVLIMIVVLAKNLFLYFQGFFMAYVQQSVMRFFRDNLFSKYQRLSLDYFHRRRTGQIISRVTNDVVVLNESIDIGSLMDEIDEYEGKVREKLYRNDDERELTALLKNTEILHNVFAVKLTSGQLRYFEAHMDAFKLERFMDFIKTQYKKYGMQLPSNLANLGDLFRQMPQAVTFYKAATARNQAMVRTIRSIHFSDEMIATE